VGFWPRLYIGWAVLAIGLSLIAGGLKPENVTRLLVIGFLLLQVPARQFFLTALPRVAPRTRFVLLGTSLAAVVEGFHMISRPVFLSLTVTRDSTPITALTFFGIDLLFTLPAYLVIFSVIWWFLCRYRYGFWSYAVTMGLAQTLGDGGLFFFAGAPPMLLFLPYPMTNYHAINVLPFLAVEKDLPPGRTAGPGSLLAIPGVIATYLVCGALIQWLGRFWGFNPG